MFYRLEWLSSFADDFREDCNCAHSEVHKFGQFAYMFAPFKIGQLEDFSSSVHTSNQGVQWTWWGLPSQSLWGNIIGCTPLRSLYRGHSSSTVTGKNIRND